MITENLSTLKIHKLTKEQYDREFAAGRIDKNALYLTQDEEIDSSLYATVEQLNNKADISYVDEKFSSISGGGGVSVQPDWNQTDETAADFIKNKPFGEYEGLVDILPLRTNSHTVTMSFGGQFLYGSPTILPEYTLALGETYIVSWDGVEYECVVQDVSSIMPGTLAMGDGSAFGFIGKGEPFAIMIYDDGYIQCISLTDTEAGGSHSVRIAQKESVVKPIDPKYLPESLQFGEHEGLVDLLPLTTYSNFSIDQTFGVFASHDNAIFELTAEEEYVVYWDGNEYTCVAQDANALLPGAVILGNALAFGLSGNNEPFVIGAIKGQGVSYYSLTDTEAGGSHSIRVSQEDSIVERIDTKYLPEASEYLPSHLQFGTIPAGTVVLDELVVAGSYDATSTEGVAVLSKLKVDYLIAGVEYKVDINGTVYTSIAQYDAVDNVVAITTPVGVLGNLSNIKWSTFHNYTSSIRNGTRCRIKVTLAEDIIKKLDPKYLSDDIGGTALPEVTTSDVGKFLRVGADGTWVAEAIPNAEEASF